MTHSNQVTETAPVERNAAQPKAQSIKEFLRTKKAMIAQALEGTALTPERLLSITMTEMRKTPKLRECTRDSLFGSMVQAAQLGLEPGSALGQCYLIPYRNKAARTIECQFQIGYKGMIALARRSGQVQALYAHCVHENDEFEIEYGLVQKLVHKPCLERDPGAVIGAYAVAHLVGGGEQFVYLARHKLDKIRAGSQGSIWSEHFEAMCQKSAARALFKWLPVSVEAMTAAALDEQADAGKAQQNGQVFGDDEKAQVFDHETGEILESHIGSAADLNEAL
jgi:recombination protein RecT